MGACRAETDHLLIRNTFWLNFRQISFYALISRHDLVADVILSKSHVARVDCRAPMAKRICIESPGALLWDHCVKDQQWESPTGPL